MKYKSHILLALLLFSLCAYVAHYNVSYEKLVIAHKAETAALLQEVSELQEDLDKKNALLERFTNPIMYDSAPVPTYDIKLSAELQKYTYQMCTFYGVESSYEVVLALMWKESNFDIYAESSTGDSGLMQINEINHEYLKQTLGLVDMKDPRQNIEAGVYIYSTLLNKYGDVGKALVAYNMGSGGAAELFNKGTYSTAYSKDVLSKAELIKNMS